MIGTHGAGPELTGDSMPGVPWFSGTALNHARNGLRTAATDPDRTAIIYQAETGRSGQLDEELDRRLRSLLRAQLSPGHVPDEIHQVPGIPRTLSGKKLEVPVRKILLGTPVAEAAGPDALASPDVLACFAPEAGR